MRKEVFDILSIGIIIGTSMLNNYMTHNSIISILITFSLLGAIFYVIIRFLAYYKMAINFLSLGTNEKTATTRGNFRVQTPASSTARANRGMKPPKNERENEWIFISKLDIKARPCCYQTARLGEQYCMCGRSVDDKLISILNEQSHRSSLQIGFIESD
ncbi:MAG: hypothetical protein ACXAD7_19935 [Candidatus Kariarchaeaceae archaeon]